MLPAQSPAPKRLTLNQRPVGVRVLLRLRSLAAGALIVGLVAACSAQATEDAPTPVVTTPEPTPEVSEPEDSPTSNPADAPMYPRAGRKPTEEGALAAAQYFMDLIPYASSALDTSLLRDMSRSSCNYCANLMAQVESWKVKGYQYEDFGFHVKESDLVKFENSSSAAVHFLTDDKGGILKAKSGKAMDRFSAAKHLIEVDLMFREGYWRVSRVGGNEL